MVAGSAIYVDNCSACHDMDGKGVPYLFSTLAGSPNVRSADPTSLIRVVIEGARSVAMAAELMCPGMPSFAWKLSDDQAAAVLTFIPNSWGSSAPAVDWHEVEQARARAAIAATTGR
jgi:mono/diheme cytochrome c family protein